MTGSWVAIVPGRRRAWRKKAGRGQLPQIETRCPFCPGHESDTEKTLSASPTHGDWEVRVVPNRFPIVGPDCGAPTAKHPLRGHHEVIVETRAHEGDLSTYSVEHTERLLRVYRDRARVHVEGDEGLGAVALYRNRGRRAGASQPHPHGQLVATQVVGTGLSQRQSLANEFYQQHSCTLLGHELAVAAAEGREIFRHSSFVAACPRAPHFNHQAWLAPLTPMGAFWSVSDQDLKPLASAVKELSSRIHEATSGRDYNLVFRNPPVADAHNPASFWYLDFMPRGGGGAGFELGTGIDCVVVSPEAAAEDLREARP